MQKKLIALAVAGLASTGAFAQVTLYGVADAYVGSFKTEGKAAGVGYSATRTAVNGGLLSGSRIGFTAEEDLGSGLKAVARYENAINIDANGSTAGNAGIWGRTRQAYVGIDTAVGRFSLGEQYSPGYFAALASDGFAGAAAGPHSILTQNSGATITPNSGARIDNSINWVSKPFGPVSFNVLYGLGEDNKDSTDTAPNEGKLNNIIALGAQAKIDALTADFVYSTKNIDDSNKQKEVFVGAAYNILGKATVGASYQTNSKDQSATLTVKDKILDVSVIVPVGAGNVHAAYAKMSSDATANDGQKSMSVAYSHALGKRTTLYAAYNQTKRDVAGTINAVGIKANAEKASLLAAGMRLTF